MFYATRRQVYCRFDTDDMAFASTLMSHKQTNTHSAHTGTNTLTHKCILQSLIMSSQQLSAFHLINHSLISKLYFIEVNHIFPVKKDISHLAVSKIPDVL